MISLSDMISISADMLFLGTSFRPGDPLSLSFAATIIATSGFFVAKVTKP